MNRSYRKLCPQIARHFLTVLALLSLFSISLYAQTDEPEEAPVILPEQAMKQVVRRILIWYFKPGNQKRIVYLADSGGVQKAWLPKIKGVEFQLLPETEAAEMYQVRFFAQLEKVSPDKYEIGFALGEPNCSYVGDLWKFRVTKRKVRLWKTNLGIGGGCGKGGN